MGAAKRGGEGAEQALFREALRQWLDWYMSFHGDNPVCHAAGAEPEHAGTVYDAAMRALSRASNEHADPTLNKLLADERRHLDWPASIHAIVMDMPREWRLCLLGTALEYSQAYIGKQLGLRQQLVSIMLGNARRTLLLRLRVLARTRRMMGQLGMRVEEAGAGEVYFPAITDIINP